MKTSRSLCVLFCFVTATLGYQQCNAEEAVYTEGIKSSIYIETPYGSGSGVLFDMKQKLALTNAHVVREYSQVSVVFPKFRNGKTIQEKRSYSKAKHFKARVIARDEARDLAVIKLKSIPAGAKAVKFGQPARPGQSIHAIGNPGASQALWVYNSGRVRANYYTQTGSKSGMKRFQRVETHMLLSPGDSGGPMFNDSAELIALNQGGSAREIGFNWGVDISEIRWFIQKHELEKSGTTNQLHSRSRSPNVGNSLADLSLFSQSSKNDN